MTENDYILIQQYIQGELSDTKRANFALRLKKEPELKAELEWQQKTSDFLQRQTARAHLKETFIEIEDDYFSENSTAKVVSIKRRKWIGIATIVAAAAVLLLIFNPFASPGLYEKYAQPSALSLAQKSDANAIALRAETAFNARKFSVAYEALSDYLNENPDDTLALLYQGMAATEINKYAEAEQIFIQIRDGQTALRESGRWYLALLYVRKGELEKAKIELQGISTDAYPQAADLLQELNEL